MRRSLPCREQPNPDPADRRSQPCEIALRFLEREMNTELSEELRINGDAGACRSFFTPMIEATLADWLNEAERVQLMLRLTPRLREKY
jgi:hypothetical protein